MGASLMPVNGAFSFWRTQLSTSARRSLTVNWSDSTRAVRFGAAPMTAIDQLTHGDTVSWVDLVGSTGSLSSSDAATLIEPLLVRAEESFRERGHHGLNLVVGTAAVPGQDGLLPIALLPVVARRRARRLPDIDVESTGPLVVCPSTMDLLVRDFALRPELDLTTTGALLAALSSASAAATAVGVQLNTDVGLVAQSSSALDVQRDLDRFTALADSKLIRALAGDPTARVALRAPIELGDVPEPLTILPVDSSQLDVVFRAAAGATMIVEGPPGTGKSQTIANVIATAVAAGKTVLFVAQKRAAVDVVVRRLADADLAHLVLDVHDDAARFDPPTLVDLEDATGPIQLPKDPPPLLTPVASAHATAVLGSWTVLPDLITRTGAAVPDIGPTTVAAVSERVAPVAAALDAFAACRRAMTDVSFDVSADALLALLTEPAVDLEGAVRLLAQLPDGVGSLNSAIALGGLVGRVAQVIGHLRSGATVPVALSPSGPKPDQVRDMYAGPLPDRASQSVVVENCVSLVADLRSLGLVGADATFGEVASLVASADWASLRSLPMALLEQVRVSGSIGLTVPTAALAEAVSFLRLLAERRTESADADWQLLAELASLGEFSRFVSDAAPGSLLRASVAEALLRAVPLASAAELAAEVTAIDEVLIARQRAGREAAATAAAKRAKASRTDPAVMNEALAFEGLARHARTRRVTNAEVLRSATAAALGLTPVVVASPTGAARSIPPIAELFDVVVFDEASQVETAIAVSALGRAKQAVIFGDSLQLPPDRFFQTAGPTSGDAVLSQSSLLDAFATLLTGTDRTTFLRWHYRSQDGRLVEHVNRSPRLYGGRMQLVPAPPVGAHPIELVRYDGDPVAALQAVVGTVVAGHSLAVLTLGKELADRLEAASSLPIGPEDEQSIVRNIERFQGDERDHVVLVLPPVAAGASALTALGPVNQAGGERRLNVALTRARVRLTVLSAFGSEALAGASSPGAGLLQEFLVDLERGRSDDVIVPIMTRYSDPVIAAVIEKLQQAGFEVLASPSSSSAVPLAVRATSGEYVAIDIDTPELARLDVVDREVLLPRELSKRGWRRVRVTAKDMIDQPAAVMQQIEREVGGGSGRGE